MDDETKPLDGEDAELNVLEINPTRNKRTPAERERDLELIANLYLKGASQLSIAETVSAQYPFKLTRQQISYDLEKLRERWKASSLRKFDELKAEQLAKIDRLENQYSEGWERSMLVKSTTTTEKVFAPSTGAAGKSPVPDTARSRATIRAEQTIGDPRFLAGVTKCIEMRCALMGLNDAKALASPTNRSWMDILKERQKRMTAAAPVEEKPPTVN